jgi:hypothetical protein
MSPKPVLKKRFTLISLGFLLAMALMAFVLPRRPARADEKTPFKATLPAAQNLGGGLRDDDDGRNGRLHIVKDCDTFSGIPGSSTCHIVESNLPELPSGTIIYYSQITGGPAAGAKGYLDSTIFVYVREGQWAVGRCTIANDDATPGLCTLSDGEGPLAGFSARIVVTHAPGGDGYLYNWDGKYKFDPVPER